MERKASKPIVNFALNFCNRLGKQKTTVCSPLSAESVLALLALGCQNESRAELLKALEFPDNDALRSSFGYLISTLKSVKGATLRFANKVYIKRGGTLKAGIKKDAEEVFRSSIEQLDFIEKEAAADAINTWVKQATNNKIKSIVTPEMIGNSPGLILVNATYFKGTWVQIFDESQTKNRPFHVNNTTEIKVPQMYMEKGSFKHGYSETLRAQMLQMEYVGKEASMVIVLPNEIEGIYGVMAKVTKGYDLINNIEVLQETDIDVTIPKFRIQMTIDLKKMLPTMGIKSIFNPMTANIDMLTSNKKLFVSEAIQKVFIDVNEFGTEAGVCTETDMVSYRERESFTADRPFLYLLMAHKIPLFIGIYKGVKYACS